MSFTHSEPEMLQQKFCVVFALSSLKKNYRVWQGLISASVQVSVSHSKERTITCVLPWHRRGLIWQLFFLLSKVLGITFFYEKYSGLWYRNIGLEYLSITYKTCHSLPAMLYSMLCVVLAVQWRMTVSCKLQLFSWKDFRLTNTPLDSFFSLMHPDQSA